MQINDDNLIWIDLEMTGLDVDQDTIIEIATIVTDSQLHILAEGPELAIKKPQSVLDAMGPWCTKTHTESGLVERIKQSKVDMQQAEQLTIEFLSEWVPKGKSPMCGNSICQDRRFLHREMPLLEQFFHYRHVDVSTVKELAKRWQPEVAAGFVKEAPHLALADIRLSIEELQYYRQRLFTV